MVAGQAHRREPRALGDHAGDDLPEGELAVAGVAEGVGDAKLAGDRVHHGDGSHRESLVQAHGFADGPEVFQVVFVAQCELDRFDLAVGAGGEICDGAVLDLLAFAVALAEEVAGVSAVLAFTSVDVHNGHNYTARSDVNQEKNRV